MAKMSSGNRDIRLQGNGPPSVLRTLLGRALRILDVEIAGGYVAAEFRKPSEIASPKPTPAPVMSATRPLRSNSFPKRAPFNIHGSNLGKFFRFPLFR